jgi:hypothetical protein
MLEGDLRFAGGKRVLLWINGFGTKRTIEWIEDGSPALLTTTKVDEPAAGDGEEPMPKRALVAREPN